MKQTALYPICLASRQVLQVLQGKDATVLLNGVMLGHRLLYSNAARLAPEDPGHACILQVLSAGAVCVTV